MTRVRSPLPVDDTSGGQQRGSIRTGRPVLALAAENWRQVTATRSAGILNATMTSYTDGQ